MPKISISLLITMLLIFSCSEKVINISPGQKKIIDIVMRNYGSFVVKENKIPLVVYPVSLSSDSKRRFPKPFSEKEELYKKCKQERIQLIYICSANEIWLEIENHDGWFNAHSIILGKVIGLKPSEFEMNYYEMRRVKNLKGNWYTAEMVYSLVN